MRIQHRSPYIPLTDNREGLVPEPYARDVERQTEQRQTRFAAAERALAQAERRAANAAIRFGTAHGSKAIRLSKKNLATAWALVEFRREELNNLHKLMTHSPASASHRGTASFGPVPKRHGGPI